MLLMPLATCPSTARMIGQVPAAAQPAPPSGHREAAGRARYPGAGGTGGESNLPVRPDGALLPPDYEGEAVTAAVAAGVVTREAAEGYRASPTLPPYAAAYSSSIT